MLASRIIPCLDVTGGRVVKGLKFSQLREVGLPRELAFEYENQGADEIVVLDISATDTKQDTQIETVRNIREILSIPLTVGGGIRTVADVQRLMEAGADKVSINTAAVKAPKLVYSISSRFGRQCTVVAIDAKSNANGWHVVTHAGKRDTDLDVVEWAATVEELGAGEILLTSFDRDGTRSGYDCDLLNAVSSTVSIPVIASGGADSAEHLADGFRAGACAVLVASILHDGITSVAQLKNELIEMGVNVRR